MKFKLGRYYLLVCLFLAITLFSNSIFAQAVLLPEAGTLVEISENFSLPHIAGVKYDPQNPFNVEFIFDSAGKNELSEKETSKMIRYFLTALTIPEDKLWVNLSPYEADRIIDDGVAVTEIGELLLSQDYLLKQLSASLTHPDTELGAKYWSKIHNSSFIINNSEADSFSKIWITPGKISVYDDSNTVFISEAELQVQTEADYLAMQNNQGDRSLGTGNNALRDVLVPTLYKDVNNGRNFAELRQMFRSVLLAQWFKRKFAKSLYGFYFNSSKTAGLDVVSEELNTKVFEQYVSAFNKGVYSVKKKETNPVDGRLVKRHYFSGGISSAIDGSKIRKVDFKNLNGEVFVTRTVELGSSSSIWAKIKKSLSRLGSSTQEEHYDTPDKIVAFLTEYWSKREAVDNDKFTQIELTEKFKSFKENLTAQLEFADDPIQLFFISYVLLKYKLSSKTELYDKVSNNNNEKIGLKDLLKNKSELEVLDRLSRGRLTIFPEAGNTAEDITPLLLIKKLPEIKNNIETSSSALRILVGDFNMLWREWEIEFNKMSIAKKSDLDSTMDVGLNGSRSPYNRILPVNNSKYSDLFTTFFNRIKDHISKADNLYDVYLSIYLVAKFNVFAPNILFESFNENQIILDSLGNDFKEKFENFAGNPSDNFLREDLLSWLWPKLMKKAQYRDLIDGLPLLRIEPSGFHSSSSLSEVVDRLAQIWPKWVAAYQKDYNNQRMPTKRIRMTLTPGSLIPTVVEPYGLVRPSANSELGPQFQELESELLNILSTTDKIQEALIVVFIHLKLDLFGTEQVGDILYDNQSLSEEDRIDYRYKILLATDSIRNGKSRNEVLDVFKRIIRDDIMKTSLAYEYLKILNPLEIPSSSSGVGGINLDGMLDGIYIEATSYNVHIPKELTNQIPGLEFKFIKDSKPRPLKEIITSPVL